MPASSRPPVFTKQQLALQHLRGRILGGKIKPGERIVIDRIAEELEMSPIPVREAISQLAREGLLIRRAHAGAVVADMPPEAIEEIFALLEALEVAAARLAVARVDAKVIEKMRRLCAEMDKTRQVARWAALNRRFHQALAEEAELGRILSMQIRVGEDWERLRNLSFASAKHQADIRQSNQDHRRFVDLLEQGKPAAVEKWIRRHNRTALERYREGA